MRKIKIYILLVLASIIPSPAFASGIAITEKDVYSLTEGLILLTYGAIAVPAFFISLTAGLRGKKAYFRKLMTISGMYLVPTAFIPIWLLSSGLDLNSYDDRLIANLSYTHIGGVLLSGFIVLVTREESSHLPS